MRHAIPTIESAGKKAKSVLSQNTSVGSVSVQGNITSLPIDWIAQSQKTVGNRQTQLQLKRLKNHLGSAALPIIQRKLKVDAPDSSLEREADRIAEEVTRQSPRDAQATPPTVSQMHDKSVQRSISPDGDSFIRISTSDSPRSPSKCGDYDNFDFAKTEHCGVVDFTHENPEGPEALIEKVRKASSWHRYLTKLSEKKQPNNYLRSFTEGTHEQRTIFGINSFQTRFRIKKRLSRDQVRSVALAIHIHVSHGFEKAQEKTDWATGSSYSFEDLPSNWISFYRAAKDLSHDDVMKLCGCTENLKGKPKGGKSKSFLPQGKSSWPPELSDIQPAPEGELWEVIVGPNESSLNSDTSANGGGPQGTLQRKAINADVLFDADKGSSVTMMPQGAGKPLSRETREFMEDRFNINFDHVRVHSDSKAADNALALNARAYTIGSDIIFGAAEYRPETQEGQRLLAHELVHVVQQTGQRLPSRPRVNNALEKGIGKPAANRAASQEALPTRQSKTFGVIQRKPTAEKPVGERDQVASSIQANLLKKQLEELANFLSATEEFYSTMERKVSQDQSDLKLKAKLAQTAWTAYRLISGLAAVTSIAKKAMTKAGKELKEIEKSLISKIVKQPSPLFRHIKGDLIAKKKSMTSDLEEVTLQNLGENADQDRISFIVQLALKYDDFYFLAKTLTGQDPLNYMEQLLIFIRNDRAISLEKIQGMIEDAKVKLRLSEEGYDLSKIG
jgi:hypothetical protein